MKPYLSPAAFKIFAHRGSTEGGATENTIEAFEFAQNCGITFMETDVQATADGVAVVFHDDDLARTLGMKIRVSELVLGELKRISIAAGAEIPTLAELLLKLPTARFNIDFKSQGAITPGVYAIEAAKAQTRVLVSSFAHKRRLQVVEKLPDVATSGDALTLLQLWTLHKLGMRKVFARLCREIDALQIPVNFGPLRFDTQTFVQWVRGNGLELHFWTINDYDEALRLKRLGATGIVTDQGKMMFERFRAERVEII